MLRFSALLWMKERNESKNHELDKEGKYGLFGTWGWFRKLYLSALSCLHSGAVEATNPGAFLLPNVCSIEHLFQWLGWRLA